MMHLKEAFECWELAVKPFVIGQYGENDYAALSESWNNYTDALCKDGDINELQYHFCPSWDDMNDHPETDHEYILEQTGFNIEYEQIKERPDNLMSNSAQHYKVTLNKSGNSMELYYSCGDARGVPELDDVFFCVLSDCDYFIINDIHPDDWEEHFSDWCSEYRYNDDFISHFRIYQACAKQYKKFRKFINESLSDEQFNMIHELFEDY